MKTEKILLSICIAAIVLIVLAVLGMASIFIYTDATNSWIVTDTSYQTIDSGRQLRHRVLVDPVLGWRRESVTTDLVPEGEEVR